MARAGLRTLVFRPVPNVNKLSASLPAPNQPPSISVVIPTLNEEDNLPETLRHLIAVPEVLEIIVADGGSRDETLQIAASSGCRTIQTRPGRGRQLNAGAWMATGDVVLLLHADTLIPADAGLALLKCLKDPKVVGGGFWKQFPRGSPVLPGSQMRCFLRLKLFGRILGDQGIFARRETLEAIGGIPEWEIMEEFELCRSLRRHGKLVLAESTVVTSARRFKKLGFVRAYLRMGRVWLRYELGGSIEELRRIYERE